MLKARVCSRLRRSLSATRSAQTVGFATLQPGTLLNAQASVIAKVVQDNSKLQVRVIGHGGDTGIIDAVNSKQADFLLLDVGEPAEAQRGENVWKGNPKPNIRAALTLFGFQMAFWVRKDSPVQSIADLKGKNVPAEWVQQTSVITHLNALLAAGGVTLNDVKHVPTVNVIRASEDFKSGKHRRLLLRGRRAEGAGDRRRGRRPARAVDGNPARLGEADEGDPARVLLLHRQPGAAHRRHRPADQGADHRLHHRRRHPRARRRWWCDFIKAVHSNKKGLVEGHPNFNAYDPEQVGQAAAAPCVPPGGREVLEGNRPARRSGWKSYRPRRRRNPRPAASRRSPSRRC